MKQRLAPFLDLLDARYLPLLFVAAPQAYTVYAWLLAGGTPYGIAFLGGVGFEFVYVGAIAWAERGAGWSAARPPAVAALLFSVSVAVAHYATTQGYLAVLHAGFPIVAYAYTLSMHAAGRGRTALADVARERTAAEQRAEQAEQARQLAEQEAERVRGLAAQERTRAEHAEHDAAQWRTEAEQRLLLPDTPPDATVTIGGRAYSVRAAADALGLSPSTLSDRLVAARSKE